MCQGIWEGGAFCPERGCYEATSRGGMRMSAWPIFKERRFCLSLCLVCRDEPSKPRDATRFQEGAIEAAISAIQMLDLNALAVPGSHQDPT